MRNIKSLPDIIKFCATIGNLPTSYMQSLSYEEQLLWLLNFLNKTILPTMHETIDSVEELENWFNNLDVQEEINNKLDEMAESGELEEIISEYLNSTAVFGFDTIADMLSATNLIDGSFARTCGSTNFNNGYGALYKIRTVDNDDTVDGVNLIAMLTSNTLVAEKIKDIPNNTSIVTVGTNNCTYTSVAEAVAYAKTIATNNSPVSILIMGGTYNEELDMRNCHGISLIGLGKVKIQYNSTYPMAPLYVSGDCYFENIDFYSNHDGTYSLHLDPSSTGVTGNCIFRNCNFETGADNGTATVGLGLAHDTGIYFYGCKMTNNANRSPFFCHTNANENSANVTVWVENCDFVGENIGHTSVIIDNGGYTNGYTTGDNQFHFINNTCHGSKLVVYRRESSNDGVCFGYIPYSDNGVKLRNDSYGNNLVGLNYDYTKYANVVCAAIKSATAVSGKYFYIVDFKDANLYNVTVNEAVVYGVGTAITGTTVDYTSATGIILKDSDSTGAGNLVQFRLTLTPKNTNYNV